MLYIYTLNCNWYENKKTNPYATAGYASRNPDSFGTDQEGEEGTEEQIRQDEDVLEALKSLGYSQNEARDALKQIPQEILGTNAKIKDALRILGGRN